MAPRIASAHWGDLGSVDIDPDDDEEVDDFVIREPDLLDAGFDPDTDEVLADHRGLTGLREDDPR